MNQTTETTVATETAAEEKAKPSKAHLAMRAELNRTVGHLDEAIGSGKLTDWEKNFLTDLATRFKQFGLKTRLSAAQMMTMNRAVAKSAVAA